MSSRAIVFGSPVAVGHVRPLMPLAKRLVERGLVVVWAISGDADEPAAKWRAPLEALGVTFVDLDETARFTRGTTAEFASSSMTSIFRRVTGRANDLGAAAADAIRGAVAGRTVIGGVYDFFAVWAYVAMRRLGIARIDVVVSAFPTMLDGIPPAAYATDPVFRREVSQLHASGFAAFAEDPRAGIIPRDPALRILSFSSPHLCPAPAGVRVLGVQHDALPRVDDLATAPPEHHALARRLAAAREGGARVVLLSMGTVVTRLFARFGPTHLGFLRRLYTTLARAALDAGAVVVASLCDSSAADLGVDEATLGAAARDRVIAMPFVPQPLLFAHGLVDVMLMHGGANTFHEAVVSGIPLLISPAFGDQEHVAIAADRLGVGVCVESLLIPTLAGARSIEDVATAVVPAMLAPGVSRWKATAASLALQVQTENGLDAAEALLLEV